MPTFHHDGIDLYYESIGRGSPMVFCHGLTGDLDQPKRILAPLSNRRLIVWDARAHGRTEPVGPAEKLNFAIFADDLRALLDHLAIDRATVGGISMGAGVATRFACHWPDRVEKLILVRPAWFDRPWPVNLAFVRTVAQLIDTGDIPAAKRQFANSGAYRALRSHHQAAADAAMSYFDKPRAIERNARLWRIPASFPLESCRRGAGVTCPALVLGCHDDPIHPFALAKQWAGMLAQATLHTTASAMRDRATYEQDVRQFVDHERAIP